MNRNYLISLLAVLAFTSCHTAGGNEETEVRPVASVKCTGVTFKDMNEQVRLTATAVYLQRSRVNAPVAGYIIRVHVKYGDAVTKGQVLYEMETKERVALNNSTITVDSSLRNFGQIIIKAPVSGIVTTIDRQQTGEYIMEGNPFCTITRNSDLAFQLNVPYEYHSLVERNRKCAIVLPDKSRIQGRIVKALSALNPVAQTQIYLVAPAGNTFLPEGLVASVLITTNSRPHAQVLPREAVLSDELMKNFWIMKLVNDTTAVKVDITTGISNENEMEIVSPVLSPADRIISEGNYGLADTASVKIIK